MDQEKTGAKYVEMWKNNTIDSLPVKKTNFVQIFTTNTENKKKKIVHGHICLVCEKFLKGRIGGTQYKHKCEANKFKFSSAQRGIAKKAAVKMVKTDMVTFNTTHKDGFVEYTKEILQLGSELGQSVTKNLTVEQVKELLPHPTTVSNHINDIASKKKELYAYLRKEAEKSGFALIIDGTSKSYHYTGIVLTYIDNDWQLKKILCDLIADVERGGQAAKYATEKVNEFLNEFGITLEELNAIITDEAAPMKCAFNNTKKHIVCGCHLCSTVSKHNTELYAADKKTMPELDKQLEKIRELLKKLKEVITLIRSRIYIHEKLSISVHQSNATRWLSTLTSIESFLGLDASVHALIEKELKSHHSYSKYLDLKQSTNELKSIFDVLRPTRHLIRSFESDKSPTLHLVVPGFAELYQHYENIVSSDDWIEASMKKAGKLAIQEKVPVLHELHYYAVLLDPNNKFNIESYILPDRKGIKKSVPDLLEGLKSAVYDYAVDTGKYIPPQITAANNSPFARFIQPLEEDFKRTVFNEVDRYLLDEDKYTTSLLAFWKNASNYPYLSYYAKHLFSIPASSSPVERSFNVLNKADNKERPQLTQETISNIVISNAIEKYLKQEYD